MTRPASAAERLGHAGAATLLVHLSQSLLASGVALPLGASFTVPSFGTQLGPLLLRVAVYTVANALFAPALCMTWLYALLHPTPLRELTRRGFARYGLALRVSLACATCAGLLLALGVGSAWLVHRALSSAHDARLQDLGALAACLPTLIGCSFLLTIHDTARAAVALDVAHVRAALRAGYLAASARVIVERNASGAFALALFALGLLGPRLLFGAGPDAGLATLLITQALALAMTLARGLWLARALTHTERVLTRASVPRT